MLEQRGRLPVFRIVALEAAGEGRRHGAVEEGIFAVNLFAASPARVAAEVRLGAPEHEDLPVVLGGLGDKASLVALYAGGLAHQRGIPGGAHARGLRELRGGDGFAPPSRLALHHAVNAFGTADIGNAETRNSGAHAEAVDLLIDGHERQQIVDALGGGQIGIVKREVLKMPLIDLCWLRGRLRRLRRRLRGGALGVRRNGEHKRADRKGEMHFHLHASSLLVRGKSRNLDNRSF